MTDFRTLIEALCRTEVRFVLVGGVAATLHGSARLTQDVDIVYARDEENLGRIVRALEPLHPILRDAPADLPFHLDARTLRGGLNFTFATAAGDIDLWGEIAGVGSYEAMVPHTIAVTLFGFHCRCLDLPTLIAAKMAAGRPKDLETVAELQALQGEETRKG